MRAHQVFQAFGFVGLAVVVTAMAPAIAQEHRGTLEQQMACTPDVFRLCGSAIPDENRIVACLQANTLQLSGPCRAVFESNDSANRPAPQYSPQQAVPPVRRGYQYQ